MKLKDYQLTAIDKLVTIGKKLLEKEGPRVCVLKSPTGSGKTLILAKFLEYIANENLPSDYAFIWISGNKLHEQSRAKLESYLNPSRYTFSYLDEVQNNQLDKNEIVFVNWHSLTKQDKKTGEYTNIFMRDNESDKNLRTFINNTKDKGLQIILIVDESHYHYWSQKSQALVQDVIGPKLTLEVSATPKLEPNPEDISNEDTGFVSSKFEDVVASGMIKSEVVVNKEIGEYSTFKDAADEAILSAAIEKQKELEGFYKKKGIKINPLLLIQLPNETEKTSSLDKTKLEFTEKYLNDKYNISVKNGLLGIWLSERKENIESISDNLNDVKVLIFKQAIALGWDCPRAQLLVMFREIKSVTFEIQTVGRIMRMPEAKHYENDELNRAFVYTNLGKIDIAKDKESQSFFKIYPSHRKQKYASVKLPSVYLSRIDYGDLTLSFRKLFIEEANKYFGISEKDFPHIAKEKADRKLDFLPKELTEPVISDVVISGVDNVESVLSGKLLHFTVPEDDLKYMFELFSKLMSLPYAPVRSHTKIQQGFYDWFDNYLGYKDVSRLEIQRIVVCSVNNQKIFKEIIESAKEKYKEVHRKEKQMKQVRRDTTWDVPVIDYYNELNEQLESKSYAMDPCYLKKSRREPEKLFEEKLIKSKNVTWWYKNGEAKEIYFAIPYVHPTDKGLHSFYPDYIILFKSGELGIFDTKSGFTAESEETVAKSDALQNYIKAKGGGSVKKMVGGIVVTKPSGTFVFEGLHYASDTNGKGWRRLEI